MNDQAYRNAVIISFAMIMGQLIFAAVAWFLYSSGARTPVATPTQLFLYVWIAVALGSIAGATMFRGRIIDPPAGAPLDPAAKTINLIIAWALLEGVGLFGIVIYFLEGNPIMLYAALGFIVASAIFFFPRREWFSQ